MPVENESEPLSLLVVCAHPHDFTHVAGTCAHHVADGDRVAVVFLTDGGTTHNELLYDELLKPADQRDPKIMARNHQDYVSQKASEMRAACALFGVKDVTILPNEDNFIQITPELVAQLTEIIRERRPDIVITHHPAFPKKGIVQQPDDHFITAEVTHTAIGRAQRVKAGSTQRPHEVAQIFYTGIEMNVEEVDVVIDITDQLENRHKAEMMFASQGHTEEKSRRKVNVATTYQGWGYASAGETFVRAKRELLHRLPLSPAQRDRARESHLRRARRLFESQAAPK